MDEVLLDNLMIDSTTKSQMAQILETELPSDLDHSDLLKSFISDPDDLILLLQVSHINTVHKCAFKYKLNWNINDRNILTNQ